LIDHNERLKLEVIPLLFKKDTSKGIKSVNEDALNFIHKYSLILS